LSPEPPVETVGLIGTLQSALIGGPRPHAAGIPNASTPPEKADGFLSIAPPDHGPTIGIF